MTRIIMLSIFTTFFTLFAKAQSDDVSQLPPLTELGSGTFKGHQGGLYPNGSNTMPPEFYNDAVQMASSIQPLDKNGNANVNGEIGLVALGASTVAMFSKGIEKMLPKSNIINKELNFVNCGIGGQDMSDIMDPNANFWSVIDARVKAAGMTLEQVQVIWFQEDNLKSRETDLDGRGKGLVDDFTYMVQFCKKHYPNLKLFYVTGRHTTDFMPADGKDKHREPKAYINGWACKWLIENQINGDKELNYKGENAVAPLILWGPYFWTQGEKPRSDGYSWTPSLVSPDGVHPTEAGIEKVSKDLVDFWQTDPVSKIWFLENPGEAALLADLNYMHISINKTVVEDILYTDISDNFRMVILKDSIVVYNHEKEKKQEQLEIQINEKGTYKFLITDENEKAFAGKFIVDESLAVTIDNSKPAKDANDSLSANYIDPNAPAWIVNGANKLPKLKRVLSGHEVVKVTIKDAKGNIVSQIEDVLNKHTDLNELLERGEYALNFYDEGGAEILLPEEFRSMVRIKY